jgi:hypothetical protein
MAVQGSFWPDRDTLAEAQERIQEALATGDMVKCECCGQTVKVYSRQVYRSMALGLWILSKAEDGLLAHEIMGRLARRGYHISGNDHSKLALWDLAVRGEDQKWRITDRGRDFLRGIERIPKYTHVFDGRVRGCSDETVDIREIAAKFDLEEILNPDNLWK